MQQVDCYSWAMFTCKLSIIAKQSVPLPLGLASYYTLVNFLGESKARDITQDVVEDRGQLASYNSSCSRFPRARPV